MRNIFLATFFLCLIYTYACAQLPMHPYEKMQLKNARPDWYETTFDTNMISTKCDGYNGMSKFENYPAPVFIDNALFTINNISESGKTWGFNLEKRMLDSGKLLWQKRFDKSNLSRQEIPRLLYIFGNKVIVVSQRKINPPATSDPFFSFDLNTRMTVRKFDIESGELVESYIPNAIDTSLVKMPSAYKKADLYSNVFYTHNENEYVYVERLQTSSNYKVATMKVNQYGQAISAKKTLTLVNSTNTTSHNLEQYNADTLIYLYTKNNTLNLSMYDMTLKPIKNIPLEVKSPFIDFVEVHYVSKDYFIMINNFILPGNPFKFVLEYLVYDYTGKLLHKISQPDYTGIKKSACYFPKLDKMILLTNTLAADGLNYQLNILEAKNNLSFNVLKTFDIALPKNASPNFVYPINDQKILVNFTENGISSTEENPELLYDLYSNAESQMLFDARNLGIVTNVKDESELDISLVVYPNPAAMTITIGNNDKSKPVEVYDINGRKVTSIVEQDSQIEIDHLPIGLYLIKNGDRVARFVKN